MIFGLSSAQNSQKRWVNDPRVLAIKERLVIVVSEFGKKRWQTSGVIIETGLVLTNYHLVEKERKTGSVDATHRVDCMEDVQFTEKYIDEMIEGSDLGELEPNYQVKVSGQLAKIKFWDREMDLLLLSVSTKDTSPIKIRSFVEVEEPVVSVAGPFDKPYPHTSSGAIIAQGKHGFISNLYAKPGVSGSGVYAISDGAFLGLATRYSGRRDDKKCRCSFSRNGADILDFLKRADVKLD